ncbi:MAG: GTPase Era [Chloroflexota bacterium]
MCVWIGSETHTIALVAVTILRMDKNPPTHRSGFVAVAGRPNVGKSTLMNVLIGQKIAAVSPKPQTTRKRQVGILTLEGVQICFVDTPGVHKPHHKLGEAMNAEAVEVLEESDIVLFMVDISQPPHEEDFLLAEKITTLPKTIPVLLVLNKVDLIDEELLSARRQQYETAFPGVEVIPLSATRGNNMELLVERLVHFLPECPPFFPEGQITDVYEREIAADLIREAALQHLHDEVPHCVVVRVDEYKERDGHGAFIAATIFVERESQKPIVIGAGGSMLKSIGITARQEIETMSGCKVFLSLRVKIRKNWRNDPGVLRLFGYRMGKKRL